MNHRQAHNQTVIVNNRPLAKLNGKVFSVLDVKKRMDDYLGATQPQILKEPASLHQFYSQSWRQVLQDMIDNELMLMEAADLSYKMDKNMIEEAMVDRYGKNYETVIEQEGLTKDEAMKLVEEDMVCRSMMWYRVWQVSMNSVTPQVVYDQYLTTIKNKPSSDKWTYQMCTVRSSDHDAAEKIAKDVYKMFNDSSEGALGSSLADAVKALAGLTPNDVSVNLSNDIHLTSQELSKENLSILEGLKPMQISDPVEQKSRYDNQTVLRLFHLKEHTVAAPPDYNKVSEEIRDGLLAKQGQKVRDEYMKKLRKRYCCEDLIVEKMYGSDTQLFALSR